MTGQRFSESICQILYQQAHKTVEEATAKELYNATSTAAMQELYPQWEQQRNEVRRRVGYFSAEFLVGRLIESNLLNMGLLDETNALLQDRGISSEVFEHIEDMALGNGGLGRLAACFLDSAATHAIPLDGYGIRYRYGLFRQKIENGFQKEIADDWTVFGDPWSHRREEDGVTVSFGKQTVRAIPYDVPVIGYQKKRINTLRLWQAEAVHEFDFTLFNEQKYDKAVKERNEAERISYVLYPNDDTDNGKMLRLKQQYFFCSASLQDMFRTYKRQYGNDFTRFFEAYAIQLNDTHPVLAIPECIRLLTEQEGLPFDTALSVARKTFSYTNHTIMPEALEKWNIRLFKRVLPRLYRYICRIDRALEKELTAKGITDITGYRIVDGECIHMARLAVFATHCTNGVAQLHTDLLKEKVMPHWYRVYPERFQNKTNGITQRRWLLLANRELSKLITDTIGNRWITDLSQLEQLAVYADDPAFLEKFKEIKQFKKHQLADYMQSRDRLGLRSDFLLDVQIKRLHEYKRQLLNIFGVLDTYFGIKDGRITDFTPTVYLFGAKAAPGYYRAKGIIKFINEVARRVNNDVDTADKMQVVYVQNYDVSYAQKIIPAADVSEQISTAGTEASGTGNMKLMLNGAVTLGTYDGANIEIVERAGEENNYIFGLRTEEVEQLRTAYDPKSVLENNPRLKRVVETLVDGTFDDGNTGMFRELYHSLVDGASWHPADQYCLFADFDEYCDARLRVNRDYGDRDRFAKKGILNISKGGYFSSDRTIDEYARDIWRV